MKEKAQELVEQFEILVFNPENHADDDRDSAKECALIAIDEKIDLAIKIGRLLAELTEDRKIGGMIMSILNDLDDEKTEIEKL